MFCVRGYHVYKDVPMAAVGEDLECERETINAHDRYDVAVTKESCVISILIKHSNGTSRSVKIAVEVEDDNRSSLADGLHRSNTCEIFILNIVRLP